MGIKVGNIVRRKCRVGRMDKSGNKTATWMFSTGYFIVLQIISKPFFDHEGSMTKETVCRIMSETGEINWIDARYIEKC